MIPLEALKLGFIVVLVLIFYFIGKTYKGVLLAVLIYMGIPSIDDGIILPVLSDNFHIPIMTIAIIYYAIIWILIAIVWFMF